MLWTQYTRMNIRINPSRSHRLKNLSSLDDHSVDKFLFSFWKRKGTCYNFRNIGLILISDEAWKNIYTHRRDADANLSPISSDISTVLFSHIYQTRLISECGRLPSNKASIEPGYDLRLTGSITPQSYQPSLRASRWFFGGGKMDVSFPWFPRVDTKA